MRKPDLDGINVLALGTGITLLGVLRILGADGASVTALPSADATTRRSRWFRATPPALSGLTPEGLADGLEALTEGTALMPCSDAWVQAVAHLPEALRRRFPASVASPSALDTLVDKTRFRAALERLALPHPRTVAITSEADLDAVPDSAWQNRFLKPSDSQRFFARFGVKAFPVSDRAETRRQLKTCIDAGLPMMLQEYIPGPATHHYFIDGFIDRTGVTRALFARQRLRMHPADFGNSTLMVSVPEAEVAGAVQTLHLLLADLHYRGIFSAEFKRDERDGQFNLIEVNARPWWYVDFAARCGVDVCALAVLDALGRPVPTMTGYALGRRCVYPSHDWSAAQADRVAGRLGLATLARSWIGAYQPVFRWNDPLPVLGTIMMTIRRRLP